MGRLRSQFHSAKNAYTSAGYPGDLPADVLGPFVPHQWYKWPVRLGFGGLAVAAAIAWVILLSRPKPATHGPASTSDHHEEIAAVPKAAPGLSLSPPAMPEMPEMPDLSGMPAMPAMPVGFTGSAVPQKTPSLAPETIPLEPPGMPPTSPAGPHVASTKEPA